MSLVYPKIPAEDVIFREEFLNAQHVVDNGGSTTGAPAIADGVTLDGSTQYVTYGGSFFGQEADVTIELFFSPDFDYDEDVIRYLCDSTASSEYSVIKQNNAGSYALDIELGGVALPSIASGTYSTYWRQGLPNYLVIASTSGATDVYLNNNLVLTADATAWSPATPTNFYIGSDNAGANTFDGVVRSVGVHKRKFTAAEVNDRFLFLQTFREIRVDQLEFYLYLKTHYNDGANELTPNVGVIGDDVIRWGDGSTSTTYPTLLPDNGATFDGGDYVFINEALALLQTEPFCLGCMFNVTSSATIFIMDCREAGDEGFGIAFVTGKVRAFTDAGGAGNWSQTDNTYNDGEWHTCIANYIPNGANTDIEIYVDGYLRKTATINGFTTTTGAKPVLGAAYTMASGFYVGDMKYPFFWRININATQALDLHNNFKRQINL